MSNLPSVIRLPPQQASEQFIFSKIEFLRDTNVWPARHKLDHLAWLDNFQSDERPYALNLLHIFLYYNDSMVDALFQGAIQQLGSLIIDKATSSIQARDVWSSFLDNLLITYVESKPLNPTESGLIFARKARQVLGIKECQIVLPQQALQFICFKPTTPILFVDDFIGSGQQVIDAWQHRYTLSNGQTVSFSSLSWTQGEFLYTPIVATTYGLEEVAKRCSGLSTFPAHILDEGYSLTSESSILWPDTLKPHASQFLFNASKRAGIVDRHPTEWKGFHNLALPLAFFHSVPDATLPLYWWNEDGWRPLIERS